MILRPSHLIAAVLLGLAVGVLIGRFSVRDPALPIIRPASAPAADAPPALAIPGPATAPENVYHDQRSVKPPVQAGAGNVPAAVQWINTQYAQLLENPEIRAALRLHNARQLESEYGAYIRAMHLGPAAKQRFLEIMAEGILSQVEAAAVLDGAGGVTRDSLRQQIEEQQKSQLTALLGVDGVQKFEFFSENQRAWKSTDAFAGQLAEANLAFSSEQQLAIIAKLAEGKLKLTSDGARDLLAPLLSPEQLEQMDRYLAEERLIDQAKEIDAQLRKRSLQIINTPPGS